MYDEKRGIHFRTILHVVNRDGEVSAENNELKISNCSEALIVIANATSFNASDLDPVIDGLDYEAIVRSRISNAVIKSFDTMLETHVNDYQQFYNRVSIDLGTTPDSITAKPTDVQLREYTDSTMVNPDLEELYFNYGRYLLISCSRTNAVPANLQGLWNESILPPWTTLQWENSGLWLKCPQCERVYDLNNNGFIVKGEGGRKLMRYKASYYNDILEVWN